MDSHRNLAEQCESEVAKCAELLQEYQVESKRAMDDLMNRCMLLEKNVPPPVVNVAPSPVSYQTRYCVCFTSEPTFEVETKDSFLVDVSEETASRALLTSDEADDWMKLRLWWERILFRGQLQDLSYEASHLRLSHEALLRSAETREANYVIIASRMASLESERNSLLDQVKCLEKEKESLVKLEEGLTEQLRTSWVDQGKDLCERVLAWASREPHNIEIQTLYSNLTHFFGNSSSSVRVLCTAGTQSEESMETIQSELNDMQIKLTRYEGFMASSKERIAAQDQYYTTFIATLKREMDIYKTRLGETGSGGGGGVEEYDKDTTINDSSLNFSLLNYSNNTSSKSKYGLIPPARSPAVSPIQVMK
eukprot:PhF_6_TR19983/c0_g1_i1/m.29152